MTLPAIPVTADCVRNKSFAAKVEREEVRAGAQLLGVELADHLRFIIDALTPHAAELGLEGKRPA